MRLAIGSLTLFLTMLSPQPFLRSNVTIWLLLSIELLAICFSFVTVPQLLRAFGRTPLFHKNLVRIIQVYLLSFYIGLLSRILIFLCQLGVLKPTEDSSSFAVIVIACILRVWFTNIHEVFLPSVVIERAFASKYVNDYERVARPWIHRTLVPFIFIVSAFLTAAVVLELLSTEALAAFSACFIISCSAVYMVLLHRDYTKLRKIDIGVYENVYTLSTRFQLAENLRVMKVLVRIFLIFLVTAIVECVLFTMAVKTFEDALEWSQLCYELMDVILAIAFDFVLAIFMVTLNMLRVRRLLPHRSNSKLGTRLYSINDHRGASSVYFNQLHSSWH